MQHQKPERQGSQKRPLQVISSLLPPLFRLDMQEFTCADFDLLNLARVP